MATYTLASFRDARPLRDQWYLGENGVVARRPIGFPLAPDLGGEYYYAGREIVLGFGQAGNQRHRAVLNGIWRSSTRANTKIIGLSVDPGDNHKRWSDDIRETQGHAPNYPMIGDTDLKIAKLYGMLPASLEGTCEGRTPADNQTVRNVFVIGPDKKIELIIVYPMTAGRNFDEVLCVFRPS
jgi:peroxiredoxin